MCVCVYSSNGMPPSSIHRTHITSRQLGNIYVCVIVYVCACLSVCVCVCSDPPSAFSCNPEQRFHFSVITCIDFPQPCSDTNTHSHAHTHTHTRTHKHVHAHPMILKVTHTHAHIHMLLCAHIFARTHT